MLLFYEERTRREKNKQAEVELNKLLDTYFLLQMLLLSPSFLPAASVFPLQAQYPGIH